MKKFLAAICLIFVCIFSFASCETTFSMRQVIVRMHDAISSMDISSYFPNGKFEYDSTTIKVRIGENKLLDTQLETLNLSMIAFNSYKDMLEKTMIQKEANAKDSTILYKLLDNFYYSLKEQHIIKLSIENNINFNVNNTQDKNEFNQYLLRLKTVTHDALLANIALLNTFQNALFNKVDVETVKDPQNVVSRTYEAKILKTYLIMLKNASTLFLDKLNLKELYVYGSTENQSFETLSNITNLGKILLTKNVLSFNTLSLEKMKQIWPILTHCEKTDSFTVNSINDFNFNSLVNKIESEYNEYNASNLTVYLNKNVSAVDKANYNFAVQEMQNYKNVVSMINNLFY